MLLTVYDMQLYGACPLHRIAALVGAIPHILHCANTQQLATVCLNLHFKGISAAQPWLTSLITRLHMHIRVHSQRTSVAQRPN